MSKKTLDFSHSVIEHHDDGSKTLHHINKKHGHVHNVPVREGDVKGAAVDHDAMMDHMMDYTSMPNKGEDQDESGKGLEPMKGDDRLSEVQNPGINAQIEDLKQGKIGKK